MYDWKIGTKYIKIFIGMMIISLTAFLIILVYLTSTSLSLKKKFNADTMKVDTVDLQVVYQGYSRFRLFPNLEGKTIVRYFDENGLDAIVTKEQATEYIQFNVRYSNICTAFALTTALELIVIFALACSCLMKSRKFYFAIFSSVGAILRIIVCFGMGYEWYLIGVALQIVSLIFILMDYKKIKADNYKIENRKQLYP